MTTFMDITDATRVLDTRTKAEDVKAFKSKLLVFFKTNKLICASFVYVFIEVHIFVT